VADVKFTVLGAQGFIGRALSQFLRGQGDEVLMPSRTDLESWLNSVAKRDLGNVIYCIGLTADFREHPTETVEAHIALLSRLRRIEGIRSFIYLSSTRVYSGGVDANEDRACFRVPPLEADSLYNSSKLMGETFTLQCMPEGRVVRLSNVYGPGDYASPNFLSSILRDAVVSRSVLFRTSPDSSKDFVSIHDIVAWIRSIALSGKMRIYNLASGQNVSNHDISRVFASREISCGYTDNAPLITFPAIDISRVSEEFGHPNCNLLSDLPTMLADYEQRSHNDRPN
jgi:nucleoside-diphosphate-sugar epimerase